MKKTAKIRNRGSTDTAQIVSPADQQKVNALLGPANGDSPVRRIVGETELLQTYLPICRRTLGYWKGKRFIPYIKIGRRCLYDLESVRQALLRHQREAVL